MNHLKYDKKDMKRDKEILNLLSDADKRYKNIKYFTIFGIILAIFTLVISIIPHNFNNDFGYDLYGESNNFIYYGASFIKASNKYYLNHGKLEAKNNEIEITNVRLKCNERLIIGASKVLEGSSIENKGYDELFPKEVVDNINDWYYEITYTIKEKTNTEILPIENREWDRNLKVDPIA